MPLPTEHYVEQSQRWPAAGRHILAHYDAESIIVYQAFGPAIATYAIEHGHLGGAFSYARMSWIKPNFLWMMYRSGWGTKAGQEVVLGIRLRRRFFDEILAATVASSFAQSDIATEAEWQSALQKSDARVQWDPDHDHAGRPLARRAIQLGLRGAMLEAYGRAEILEIVDMTELTAAQRDCIARDDIAALRTPAEHVYRPASDKTALRLSLD